MSNIISLVDLEKKIKSVAQSIGVNISESMPITFGYSDPLGDGTPFIKKQWGMYCYGYAVRGNDTDIKKTTNYNEVIYWLFRDIALRMGETYWETCPRTCLDQRRYFFKRQFEILNQICPQFGKRIREEIFQIITLYPFCDGYPETLEYIDTYLEGHTDPMPDLHQEKREPFPLMFSADNMKLRIRNDLGTVEICQTSDDDCWYDLALIKNLINQEKDINRPVDKTDLILFFNKSFEQVSELFRPENYQRTKQALSLSNSCPPSGK
ncbi:hypothetical protein FACS1894170_11180 [Planctomycetales bacterium]|nr:hypothetical protein FACS1894170_11180 [Planctomycetales bacterium]